LSVYFVKTERLSVKEFIGKLVNLKLNSKSYNFIVCCTSHETVEGVTRHIMDIFTKISSHNEY